MKKNINVSIDIELLEKSKKEAEDTKRTFSLFVELALEGYFARKDAAGES